MDYAAAVAALYQTPLGDFVTERKRLAAALKAAGDKDGAKTFAKLGRPPISAWAVNQLYWHARDLFDAFMATAARMRDGDLSVSGSHRETLARLRQRAATLVTDAGHNANEAVLRRIALTLSAIAAIGSFAPDAAGALAEDRDPPGFEAAGFGTLAPAAPPPPPPPAAVMPATTHLDDEASVDNDDSDISDEERDAAAELLQAMTTAAPKRARHLSSVPMPGAPPAPDNDDDDDGDDDDARIAAVRKRAADEAEKAERDRLAAKRQAAAELAERARRDEEQKRRHRERERLDAALRTARGEIETRQRALDKARAEITRAETALADAAAIVADLERTRAALDD